MDSADTYKLACSERGCKPIPEVLQALSLRSSQLSLLSPFQLVLLMQTEPDAVSLSSMLQESPAHLKELRISGMNLGRGQLLALSAGLQGSISLSLLDLTNNQISSKDGASALFQALETNRSIETLDLSHNCLDSDSIEGLSELLELSQTLRTVIVDFNRVETCEVPIALAKNEVLTCFSLSNNPLTFECLSALLDSLVNNRSLRFLGLKGCPMDGAAPIKENCNGLLSKQEVIILKLAHVLRYSCLTALAIDLDIEAEVQLEELESTLIKHNRALTSLRAPQIDWNKVKSGPLMGIGRALKANQWLSQNEQLPKDQRAELNSELEELVTAKARRRAPSECLGYIGDLSASSSEAFQRLFVGKTTRSNSPTLLRSVDSAAPAVASPEGKGPGQLDMQEADSKTLGVTAETPQFSPYIQAFSRHLPAKPSPHFLSRTPSQQFESDLNALMDLSLHKVTQTEPTPPSSQNVSVDSKGLGKQQFEMILELVDIKDGEQRRNMEDLEERVGRVEGKCRESEENWLGVQRSIREISGKRGEISPDFRQSLTISERLEAMERKEASKVALFEALGKEMDQLKADRSADQVRIAALESQLRTETAKNDLFLKSQSDRLTQVEKQLESVKSKVTQPADLALLAEQLALLKQEREEDRVQLLNRVDNLEQRDTQVDKLKYFVSLVQKDASAKVKKLESVLNSANMRSWEARLQAIEADRREESGAGSLQSLSGTPPGSRGASLSRVSAGGAQLARLEERVADVERELSNFANVKKKLAENTKKLRSLEVLNGKSAPRQATTPTIPHSKQSNQNRPPDSLQSAQSTLTLSKLAASGSLTHRERRSKGTPDPPTDTSFGPDSRPLTERGLGDFLPGEAESVVMGALLERTQRTKLLQTDLRMSYRSISPLSASSRTQSRHEPSADLQEYLRKKGFTFRES